MMYSVVVPIPFLCGEDVSGFSPQDVLNNLGSSELDEDDLMLDLDLSDDQRHRHGKILNTLAINV